jgi:hypothetical protein
MAFIESNRIVAEVSCDLCGGIFEIGLKTSYGLGPEWESVNVMLLPHLGKSKSVRYDKDSGSIIIEHVCDPCRESVAVKFAEVIEEMRRKFGWKPAVSPSPSL